jgi:acetoin utilization deacetylase AcuC-like enzyme
MPAAPTLILRDERFLRHDAGPGHPENAARLAAVMRSLAAEPVPGTAVAAPRAATREELAAAHDRAHVDLVEATAEAAAARGHVRLDPDTVASAESFQVARLAAGATLAATEAVCGGRAHGAFALVRPPGHHAEAGRAMGFCLFNNIAVAAEHAVAALGCRRVLVLDPDIHHGNGTQHRFFDRADVLYASSHRYPFYPGTGWHDEVGRGAGAGFTINLPLPMGLGDADLLHVWEQAVAPVVRSWKPDLILVSAGFDCWHADPIGDMAVTERGFAALYALFASWADEHCPGRIACTLEGGYDPAGVTAGVRAALQALTPPASGQRDPTDARASLDAPVSIAARDVARRARATLAPWWPVLR